MSDSGGAQTERPDQHRLERARRQGVVPVSRELLALAGMGCAALALAATAPGMLLLLRQAMADWLQLAPAGGLPPRAALVTGLGTAALASAPMMGAAVIGAAVAGLVQTRGLFSLAPLRPDPGRLWPGRGRRGAGLYPAALTLARMVGVLALGLATTLEYLPRLAGLTGLSPETVAAAALDATVTLTLRCAALLLLLALADLLLQRGLHLRRLRLTRRRARRERRQREADPGLRAEQLRRHRQRDPGSASELVASAVCVISAGLGQPAVTLELERGAPVVSGSAVAAAADELRGVAMAQGCPVYHRPELALALCQLGAPRPVPRRLFPRLAEVVRAQRSRDQSTWPASTRRPGAAPGDDPRRPDPRP